MMHHEAQMKTYTLGIIGAGMYCQVLMLCFHQDKRRRLFLIAPALTEVLKKRLEK